MAVRTAWLLFVLAFIGSDVGAESAPAYLNAALPLEQRVQDLLDRLTLEEKAGLLWELAPPIERLSIPKYYHGNEALHGVVRPGRFTVFPQAIGLASTWNPVLIQQVATAISDEARGRWNELEHGRQQTANFSDLLTFWSPTVNMARDPRWGRTAETYGEDPYLTSRLGVAFVKGLQGDHPVYLKTVSTPKHYVANNVETDRFSANSVISERTLREYYLPAFRAAIVEGRAQSIMSAYNALNYVPSTANRWLLTDLLRDEWEFDGYVVADCGAPTALQTAHRFVATETDAAAAAIKAGLDLECSGGGEIMRSFLPVAYRQGKLTMAEIDAAVKRVLRARFRLGLFDPLADNPYNDISPDIVGAPAHQTLALQTALQSIVLMKNDRGFLPIKHSSAGGAVSSIAVVGHLSDKAVFGDYSGEPVNEAVTPLRGLLNRFGNAVDIRHVARDLKVHDFVIVESDYLSTPENESGLSAEYFDNTALQGEARPRIDATLDLHSAENPPDPFLLAGNQSARWNGTIRIPANSAYRLGALSDDGVRVWLDEKLIIDEWRPQPPTLFGSDIELEANSTHNLRIEWYDGGGGSAMRLMWEPVTKTSTVNPFQAEMDAAGDSDLVIAFVGTGLDHEREGVDKADLLLPGDQLDLLKAVHGENENMIVVLISGSQYEIPWIKTNAPAIVNAWYPGEQGGNAIADVLLGNYNPAGRLPLTYYETVANLPDMQRYEVSEGRTYQYYRGDPLWEFGFGLSYTEFSYTDLSIVLERRHDSVSYVLSFDVQNTGEFDGDEVVQAYAAFMGNVRRYPIKKLVTFERAHFVVGEKRRFQFVVPKEQLQFWSEESREWESYSGDIEFQIGSSSQNIQLRKTTRATDR